MSRVERLAEELDELAYKLAQLKKHPMQDFVRRDIEVTTLDLRESADLYNRLIDKEETQHAPAFGWTCFHCGFRFYEYDKAKEHFGPTPDKEPVCQSESTQGN